MTTNAAGKVVPTAAQLSTLSESRQLGRLASRGQSQPIRRREEFNKTYKQWLDEQKSDFDRNGHWSHGLDAWRDNN
jgi:hypothetical protein